MDEIETIFKQLLPVAHNVDEAAATLTLAEVQRRCCQPERGKLVLAYGPHQIEIPTNKTPSRVYLSVDACGFTVCQGALTYLASTINDGGFTLFARVECNAATVRWLAEF